MQSSAAAPGRLHALTVLPCILHCCLACRRLRARCRCAPVPVPLPANSSVVTELQFVGYAVALSGVFYYNYQKVQAVAAQQAKAAAEAKAAGSEGGGRDAEAGGGQGALSVAAAPSGAESEPMLVRGSGSRSNIVGGAQAGGDK